MSIEEQVRQAAEAGVRKALEVDPVEKRRLLTVEDAAVYLDMGKATLYQMIAAGEIPAVRRGKWLRVDVRDCEAWIHARKDAAARKASGGSGALG